MQNSKSQKGRSMVEMLGVLAIIGVLSVGGVGGYGVAMKKHKANELLHQASMLATTISAQIQSKGQLPQSIEDFGNAKYGTFKKPEKANDEQFTMQITGMDSAVCEQMEKMSGGMVRKAECNGTTLTLTYNNNLSTDKVAADGEEGTCNAGVCEPTPTCLDNTSGVKCLSNTTDENGNTIELCSGYYCNVGGACDWGTEEHTITAGDITALPSTIEKIGKYHKSDEIMTWEQAYYYCEALSKIDDSITGMAKKDSFEPVVVDGNGWTNTLVSGDITPSGNDCWAFYVDLSSGAVYNDRRDYYIYAMCE